MISYTVLTTTGTMLANKKCSGLGTRVYLPSDEPMPLEWKNLSKALCGRGRIDR